MNGLLSQIIKIFLPPRCIKCGAILSDDDGLCPKCFQELNFITAPYCYKCGHPFEQAASSKKMLCASCAKKSKTPFRLNRSALYYDDISKDLILALKFMDKTENAKTLAKWLSMAGYDIWQEGVDVLVPVPLHYKRLIKRRYNQSALLVKELSKITGIKADYTSLVKHKSTKPQVQFSGHERVKNVRGAFSVKHIEKIKGKRVVLIDDVMTTGSTLKECALALKKAGAKSVDTLTVARVI